MGWNFWNWLSLNLGSGMEAPKTESGLGFGISKTAVALFANVIRQAGALAKNFHGHNLAFPQRWFQQSVGRVQPRVRHSPDNLLS